MIAVIIPCYRVRSRILSVLARIGPEVDRIYVVDDACPEGTGQFVEENHPGHCVTVLYHTENQGVGGATLTGYRRALEDGADVLVKLDGDDQMEPRQIGDLVRPILDGNADYAKGNRFYDLDNLTRMPKTRLLGNAILSFLTKLSSGYWNILDPTNGFTAIHAKVAERLPLEKISKSYFFESDMLFRLNTIRAVVRDVPMDARYADEESGLVIRRIVGEFAAKNLINTCKRILYSYFIRNFNVASLELIFGGLLLLLGGTVGGTHWARSLSTGVPATSGTVMLAALPVVVGAQLLLAFFMNDAHDVPTDPIHPFLERAPDGKFSS